MESKLSGSNEKESTSVLFNTVNLDDSIMNTNDNQSILSSQMSNLNLDATINKPKKTNYIQAISSLILDQLNTQDAHAILEAQRQT